QPALGQREVDRTATGVAVQARVAAAFEHLHPPAALGEQGGKQGAGEAGADDGEGFGISACHVGNPASSFPRRRESSSRRSVAYFRPEIAPCRIARFNEADLPRAIPLLDLLLAKDGAFHRSV